MHLHIAALAAERISERRRDADRRHTLAVGGPQRGPGPIRRRSAAALAAVSRSSAAGVRRLDACMADDLARRLAVLDRI